MCLGSPQFARVRVPAVLSGDDEREGRREGPVRERQLPGSEAGDNFVFRSHFLNLVSSLETTCLYTATILHCKVDGKGCKIYIVAIIIVGICSGVV